MGRANVLHHCRGKYINSLEGRNRPLRDRQVIIQVTTSTEEIKEIQIAGTETKWYEIKVAENKIEMKR